MTENKKEIDIIRKKKNGKDIRVLKSTDINALLDFSRFYYLKQGWCVIEQPHLVGIFIKKYKMVLRSK